MTAKPWATTSSQVRWQAPQKSTEAAGSRSFGFMMRSAACSGMPDCMAAACVAPGPWQASQATPRTTELGSKGAWPGIALSGGILSDWILSGADLAGVGVEWQAKQRWTSAGDRRRPAASSRLAGMDGECSGVMFRLWDEA